MTTKIAIIHEEKCVGCTKCIDACPVDAIVGAPQLMHSVLTHECIGCGLCIDPCPMDCIEMVQSTLELSDNSKRALANQAKIRHIAKKIRHSKAQFPQLPSPSSNPNPSSSPNPEDNIQDGDSPNEICNEFRSEIPNEFRNKIRSELLEAVQRINRNKINQGNQ